MNSNAENGTPQPLIEIPKPQLLLTAQIYSNNPQQKHANKPPDRMTWGMEYIFLNGQ